MQILKSVSMLNIILAPALIPGLAVFIEEQGLVYTYDGTSWVVFNGPGRAEYLNPAEPVTIYVREDGYDDSGDGKTIATAYRQINRALSDIPNGFLQDIFIQLGPGDFEPFFNDKVPGGPTDVSVFQTAQIIIVGSQENPLFDPQSLSFSLVAGTVGVREATVPDGFSQIVDNTSHWFAQGFIVGGVLYFASGRAMLASASPSINVVEGLNPTAAVYAFPFESRIVGDYFSSVGSVLPRVVQCWGLLFSGMLPAVNLVLGTCRSDISTNAPLLYRDVSGTLIVRQVEASTGIVRVSNTIPSEVVRGYFGRPLVLDGPYIICSNALFDTSDAKGALRVERHGSVFLTSVDFRPTSGVCLGADGGTIRINGAQTIGASATRWADLQNGAVLTRSSGTITGSTTSEPIRLRTGAKTNGLRAGANGTLTRPSSPGNEIQVGGLGATSFANIPLNDFGLGTLSQLCGAT